MHAIDQYVTDVHTLYRFSTNPPLSTNFTSSGYILCSLLVSKVSFKWIYAQLLVTRGTCAENSITHCQFTKENGSDLAVSGVSS